MRRPQNLLGLVIIHLAAALKMLGAAQADESGVEGLHGRIFLEDSENLNRGDSLDAQLGRPDHNDGLANVRLTFDHTWNHWSFDLHYVLAAEVGEIARLARNEMQLLSPPPSTWLDLTNDLYDSRDAVVMQSIDRLSLTYSTSELVVRIGRQALSWGSGFVFRPMDLFDPFSPTATDTEFKPGTDMLYVQYLFADGSDLQFIAVPRGLREDAAPTSDESSFALHYHATLEEWDVTGLIARDHGDWVSAIGIGGKLRGAAWNVEVLPEEVRQGPTVVSVLANISDAETLAGRNATAFAEYFRNGLGVVGDTSLESLPFYLKDRISRGQLFNVRRDYVAAGLTLEWSPLVTVSPAAMADLDDGSLYLLGSVSWSLTENLDLVSGVQQPVGGRGREFGGLEISPGSPVLLSPPAQIYLQLRRYF